MTSEMSQMECGWTPWKLLVNVALKNYVCLSSACPESPVLFDVIRVFQPCACAWCCNTNTSASSVLLTVFSILCLVFVVTAVHALDVDTSSRHVRTPSRLLIIDVRITSICVIEREKDTVEYSLLEPWTKSVAPQSHRTAYCSAFAHRRAAGIQRVY